MLAGLAAGPARADRSRGAGLPPARWQWRRTALGCRADQEWPVFVPKTDPLATHDPIRSAAGRQDLCKNGVAPPAGTIGGLALELAAPGPDTGSAARIAAHATRR